jgi:hypothetical protein
MEGQPPEPPFVHFMSPMINDDGAGGIVPLPYLPKRMEDPV